MRRCRLDRFRRRLRRHRSRRVRNSPPSDLGAKALAELLRPDAGIVGEQFEPGRGRGLYGGNYRVTLRGCDFPICCAYDVYLHAWKRLWYGCNTIPTTV
jgi:hypothetical protein